MAALGIQQKNLIIVNRVNLYSNEKDCKHLFYHFHIQKIGSLTPKTKLAFKSAPCEGILAAERVLPRLFGDLPESNGDPYFGWQETGFIAYEIRGTTAASYSYFPRKTLPEARYFGYYLDLLATIDLKSLGMTHMAASGFSYYPRAAQLRNVGLDPNKPIPIEDYIAGMKRGIRLGIKYCQKIREKSRQ